MATPRVVPAGRGTQYPALELVVRAVELPDRADEESQRHDREDEAVLDGHATVIALVPSGICRPCAPHHRHTRTETGTPLRRLPSSIPRFVP